MSKIWETGTLVKDGVTYYLKDIKARELIAQCYSPSNPPPSTEGGRIWYATCSSSSADNKTATSSTGDFQLKTGAMVRVLFSNSNTATTPTLSIDGSTAKTIWPNKSSSGAAYLWKAGEAVDLVYDGSHFIISDAAKADTSFYGITKLSSSTSSTATDVAATPSAVKAAYDLADGKVSKAGDTMTGQLTIQSSFMRRKFTSAPSAEIVYYVAGLYDENDDTRGGIGFYRSNNYGDGMRFTHVKKINDNSVVHGVTLYISDTGTPAVLFGQPAAWRDGLNVVAKYSAGDTVSFPSTGNSYYQRFHGDWRYSYTLYFFVPLARSCEGLTATASGTVYVITNNTRTSVSLSTIATVNCFCAPGGVAVQLNWGSGNAPSLGQSQFDIASVQPYGFTITFS